MSEDHDLPHEFVVYSERKAAAHNPRKATGRTQEQVKAKILVECTARLDEVRAQVPGIEEKDAIAIVRKCLGKSIRELFNEIGYHHKMARLEVDKQRAVADARAETQQRANLQLQQFMQKVVERIDNIAIAAPATNGQITDQTELPKHN